MPTVPTASDFRLGQGLGQLRPLQGGLNVNPSPADFGALQAQQIGQAADGIGSAALGVMRAQAAVEERDARVRANKAGLQARLDMAQWLQEARQQAPAGAPDFTKSVMQRFQEYRAQAVEGASGLYRDLIEDDLGRIQISLFEDAHQFEAQARRAKAEADIKGGLEAAQNLVFLRPESFGEVLQSQIKLVEASGLDAEAKAKVAQGVAGALGAALWQRQVKDDPLNALAALRSGAIPGLEFQDRMRLANEAEGELRQRDAERRREEAEARMEARAARMEAREQARDARDAAESRLTADILAGAAGPADILRAVQGRMISGDQARVLTSFHEAQNRPDRISQDDPYALSLMLRAGDGDDVRGEVAEAVAQRRIKLDTARSIINDLQERQRSGGAFAREDVRAGEAALRRVIEENSGLGALTGDNAQKSLNALRMYRERIMADPSADPLAVADAVGRVWRQGTARAPRSRFMVQTPGQAPDFAASAQRLQEAYQRGEIGAVELEIETQALEQMATAMQQGRR